MVDEMKLETWLALITIGIPFSATIGFLLTGGYMYAAFLAIFTLVIAGLITELK